MRLLLNNKKIFEKYDTGQVLVSVKNLGKQCLQAQKETKKIKLPKSYKLARQIVIGGMGGSNIGGDLIRSTFLDDLKIPLQIVADYKLPKFVNKDCLVIASSYSGETEEAVSLFQEARKRKCYLFIITSGGKLTGLAKRYKIPAYIFKPFFNPSGQPRLGLGYLVMSQLLIFKKLNFINISDEGINEAVKFLEKSSKGFYENIKRRNNLAKKIAFQFYNKIPIIFAGNYLLGNAHIFSNQINENAKNFACYFALPELNHHLLESLMHPLFLHRFSFLLLESNLDLPQIKKRSRVTKKILQIKKLEVNSIKVSGPDRLSQSFWLLSFGGFVSFYLALLNKENPVLIPWVDFLKKELTRK